jgi:transposase
MWHIMLVPPLSDSQWDLVRPCLPRPAGGGRPRADQRQVLEAVLLVLANGWRWKDLPAGGGVAPATAWRHLRVWQQAGVWPRMWRAYVLSLDPAGRRLWSKALLACAFIPAHKEERRWAPATRERRTAGSRTRTRP